MQIEFQAPVSVIIPCFNCENTIIRAVNSVFKQTWQPKELILIDDGSTDGSLSRLYDLRDHLGSSWIRILELRNNNGPGAARNAGWEAATQPYLAFLDADDAWHPCKVEIQLKYMQENSEMAITGHHMKWLREGETAAPLSNPYHIKYVTKNIMLASNRLLTSTVMLKRDLSFRFEPAKRYSEDYLLWLQVIFNECYAANIDLYMAYSYKPFYGQRGLSSHLWAMERGELDTYRRLRDKRLITWPCFAFVCIFSIIKYMRRVLITKTRVILNEE